MKRFRFLNAVLGILLILAGWRFAQVLGQVPPEVPADSGAGRIAVGEIPGESNRLRVIPAVKSIRSKDLFDVSRKPVDAGDRDSLPQETPAPPPTLKLTGVLFVGTFREAVVIDESSGRKQLRLREGEEVSGYRVRSIRPEAVVLANDLGEEVRLQLLVNTGSPATNLGPGGKPTPKPAKANVRKSGDKKAKGAPQTDIQKRRADARKRAQRARERLKRLREEAAQRE